METLIASTFRAMRSLFAPGMLGVFVLSVGLTLLALTLFVTAAGAFFTWLPTQLAGTGYNALIPWAGTVGAGVIAWFLFPGIMPIIVNFFDDRIARLIEIQDYPAVQPALSPPFWPELWHDARFSTLAVLLNVLVLPLYLIPLLFPFLFYLLNGYLLGREFFVMAARRHIPLPEANALRKRHGRIVLIAGIALAVLATVPVVNLFAPFWGIALMVHLYHRLAKTPISTILPPQ